MRETKLIYGIKDGTVTITGKTVEVSFKHILELHRDGATKQVIQSALSALIVKALKGKTPKFYIKNSEGEWEEYIYKGSKYQAKKDLN